MSAPLDLAGRLAVISGAGSGIGEALATRAALDHAMQVVVADVDAGRAEAVVETIRTAGGQAWAAVADVADWDQVARLAQETLRAHGAPALVVCNAGVETTGLFWETAPEHWARTQSINVNGAFHLARAFLPTMVSGEQRSQLLFTSSIAGVGISAGQSAYHVSKHAVRVMAQALAADLESVAAPVGVSVLLPGVVATRIFDDATASNPQAEQLRATYADYLRSAGVTPDSIATRTLTALLAGERWIHDDPALSRRMLEPHAADLLAGLEAGEPEVATA